jgi:hypothetical protein
MQKLVFNPLTGNLDVIDVDTFTNASESTVTVGGIPSGTTFAGKTMAEMWTQLLYQELFPVLVAPSAAFTLTQQGLQEIGASLTLSFSATFGRGTITPAYGTSGLRSGLPNTYTYTGTGLTTKASTALSDSTTVTPYVVVAGAQNWTSTVTYDVGVQPLSNFGNNYSTPLAAGTTGSITRTITGVLPSYATTVAITTMTKQTLIANAANLTVSLVAESGSDKQMVDIPVLWGTASILEQFNPLSSAWDTVNIATFTASSITLDVNGITQNYKHYVHNGATIGARQLRWRV